MLPPERNCRPFLASIFTLSVLVGCAPQSARQQSWLTPEECRELQEAASQEDSSSAGERNEAATGSAPSSPGEAREDSVAVLDRPPRILRLAIVQELMSEAYPDNLYRLGVGGVVHVELIVRPDSTTEAIQVVRSSGWTDLDAASLQVVRRIRFEPGYYKGCPVRVKISMPLTWNPPSEDPYQP